MPTEQPTKSGKRTRTGLLTFVRKFVVDSEAECLTVGEASVMGCGEEDRDWQRRTGGVERWDVTITYQGIEAEDDSKDSVSVKQVIREEPIESHPDIESIKKTYGGTENDDGTISFPATISTTSSSSGFSSSKKATTKNPMYGAKTYGRKSAEWSRTYVKRVLPNDLLDQAGKTTKKPRGAPAAPSGKIWVYGCSESVARGNSVEITERATLEDENGAAKAVYGTLV